ncbi:putative PAS/PAC sensor protein [Methylobacterium sp. 4-46]|uniref:PAS domain-containing protein n=1 Tax=unclassified Methylobacterium TaxID=2615210 RepID=UPI000165C89F|nr:MULTISPECIES: PAS domain-containing protein [Methylobacterium]ACA16600.1 putative PAS/PAC sensor protein [Methylobacterium sp. 4-46]WFT82304.1 PAS domain-containing protein [Methylobacterium nodulans]
MDQDAIGSDAIRAALALLLQQPQLRKSPQLSTFLSYVVGESLAGRGSLLKSYTIATDALGRPANFDPATDAIVRVEARRLRQVLQQIYEDPACPLSVRIELPLGRYEPTFTRITPATSRNPVPDPEASLRESEQRYRALVEASAAIEWRASPDGRFIRSFGWTARTGEPEDRLRDEGWLDALHPEDRGRATEAWAQARRTGEPLEIAYRVRHRGGHYRWMLARGIPIENLDGSIREWVGTLSDIHEQETAEEAQRARSEGLRLALTAAGLAAWELDPETRSVCWSQPPPDRIEPPGEAAPRGGPAEEEPLDAWVARLDPADGPRLVAALERALRGGGDVDLVYRSRAPAERPRRLACRGGLVRNARGEARLAGVVADVTGRASPLP